MRKDLVFDTETTGLIRNTLVALNKQPQVFEYYGYRINRDTLEEIDELHFFAKPTVKMEEGAKKATGKNDDFFKEFLPFGDAVEKLIKYIEDSDAVVAHNCMYDFNILNMEFERLGFKVKWPRLICTVEQTESILGYRMSLTDLHQYLFGEKFTGAHEAKTDVKALGRCYIELIKRGEIK